MSTLCLSPKISGLLAGFALFATCLLSSGCAEFQGNRATNADDSHPRYPAVVVAVNSDDALELDLDVARQSDSPFWRDVRTLERKAQIWRINVYKHNGGNLIGKFMEWTDIATRKAQLKMPLETLLRVEMDFCTTKDPNDDNADCDGRQINILLHKYPD
jgi:hypothetical protein